MTFKIDRRCADEETWRVTRRDFLKASGAALATGAAAGSMMPSASHAAASDPTKVVLKFGLVTDPHYADADPAGARYYRESLDKLRECIGRMNEAKVAFLAELGDFKDQDRAPQEENTLQYLRTIEKIFARFEGPRHYVMGNHDMDSISKAQFLANTQMKKPFYSFDAEGIHFAVLDANVTSDGKDYDHGEFDWTDTNVPADQLAWLERDLDGAARPTIVFCHQRLDGEGMVFVNNGARVRKVIEASGRVLAVFQGHDHAGDLRQINGVHYYTLRAVIEGSGEENNSYAIVDVHAGGDLTVTGFRKALSKELTSRLSESAARG